MNSNGLMNIVGSPSGAAYTWAWTNIYENPASGNGATINLYSNIVAPAVAASQISIGGVPNSGINFFCFGNFTNFMPVKMKNGVTPTLENCTWVQSNTFAINGSSGFGANMIISNSSFLVVTNGGLTFAPGNTQNQTFTVESNSIFSVAATIQGTGSGQTTINLYNSTINASNNLVPFANVGSLALFINTTGTNNINNNGYNVYITNAITATTGIEFFQGAGITTLDYSNKQYTAATVINAGSTLIFNTNFSANAGSSSMIITNNGVLVMNTTNQTYTGAISGTGYLDVSNGITIFNSTSTYLGSVNCAAGANITWVSPAWIIFGSVTNNGTNAFITTGYVAFTNTYCGNGFAVVSNSAGLWFYTNNPFSGIIDNSYYVEYRSTSATLTNVSLFILRPFSQILDFGISGTKHYYGMGQTFTNAFWVGGIEPVFSGADYVSKNTFTNAVFNLSITNGYPGMAVNAYVNDLSGSTVNIFIKGSHLPIGNNVILNTQNKGQWINLPSSFNIYSSGGGSYYGAQLILVNSNLVLNVPAPTKSPLLIWKTLNR
jgi:hypothetical protein